MKHYDRTLKTHLADYARAQLGVSDAGEYEGRTYGHILPEHLKFLNLIEGFRAEIQDYLHKNRRVRLHKYFHHLNSSQALALNLFYPFLSSGQLAADLLYEALGVSAGGSDWSFEHVHDTAEGTHVDVAWRYEGGAHVFCEVKLSERDFGVALPDKRHLEKRVDTYLPKLEGLVDSGLLDQGEFFQHYQLLRNVSLLHGHPGHRLVLLVPSENETLRPALGRIVAGLSNSCRPRVSVVYLESLIGRLLASTATNAKLFVYTAQLMEKYVPRLSAVG